jgi:O-antigen biosynthesis protein WbqP
MKRIFDLILAIFLFFILPIPLLLAAILVVTTSKGPALYWSERTGKNSKIFTSAKI